MIQIRHNVFETNSSSMHSLVIKNESAFYEDEDIYFTKEEILKSIKWYVRQNKSVYSAADDDWYFGRAPFKILDNFREKMHYAFANGYIAEEILPIINKFAPEITSFQFPEYMGTDDYLLKRWLEKAGISLEEFLINKKYIVICDGDEYCLWNALKGSGIIDSNVIEEEIL